MVANAINIHRLSPDDYMDTYSFTESYVWHMAEDAFKTGYILFIDGNSLKTTAGASTSLIVGSAGESGYIEGVGDKARFDHINSFVQLSKFFCADSEQL